MPGKKLQLTFDDGPEPVATALTPILNELSQRSLSAAFFLLGSEVHSSPTAAKSISDQGNSLGNHSWDHLEPDTSAYTDVQILEQFQKTHSEVRSATSVSMRYWRAPRLQQIPRLTGILVGPRLLYSLSHCDVHCDSKDSQGVTTAAGMLSAIRADIAAQPTRSMFRILFHIKVSTAAVLPAVINGLIADGHTFVNFEQSS